MSTLKKGKSSELLVAGELLARGHNVFYPFVDIGIDLVAKVEERFVQLQVKHSNAGVRRGRFWFTVKKKAFEQNKGRDVFYIFVLKRGISTNYIIVPSLWIEQNIKVREKPEWHFYFELSKDSKTAKEVRSINLDVSAFLNSWRLK